MKNPWIARLATLKKFQRQLAQKGRTPAMLRRAKELGLTIRPRGRKRSQTKIAKVKNVKRGWN